MKYILLILWITFYIEITQGNNDRVNEGASTSQQQELDTCTQCELQSYANRLVLLMTAEDVRGGDLMELINTEFYEMEAFYNQVMDYVSMAEYGTETTSDLSIAIRNHRLGYFSSQIDHYLLLLFEKACTEHYKYRFIYKFNRRDREIDVSEEIKCAVNDNCLCSADLERSTLSKPFRVPIPKKPEKKFAIFWVKNKGPIQEVQSGLSAELDAFRGKLSLEEITAYHIIPIPLIARFFRIWLADETSPDRLPKNNYFNGCVHTLFGRLRRSMQKIFLVSLKKSKAFSDQGNSFNLDDFSFSDETVLIQTLENCESWLSGNMFQGPTGRGPFEPSFQRRGDELLYAFEYGAIEIVEENHHHDLLALFTQIIQFVNEASNWNPFERLIYGFHIFTLTILRLEKSKMTLLNSKKWEEKQPTPDDLKDVSSEETRNRMMRKKYWTIKKNPKKEKRSVDYYDHDFIEESLYFQITSVTSLKNLWNDFVLLIMKIFMESGSRGESVNWSCNLTHLHDEYLFYPTKSYFNNNCDNCMSFSEYLYSKIPDINKWHSCNFKKELTSTTSWCTAWRRIMTAMRTPNYSDYHSKTTDHSSKLYKLKFISQDIKSILHWLLEPKKLIKTDHFNNNFLILPKQPFKKYSKTGISDTALCFIVTLIPTILSQQNDCKKIMG